MASVAARGRPPLLAVAALRPSPAASRRAGPRARPRTLRAHPSRTRGRAAETAGFAVPRDACPHPNVSPPVEVPFARRNAAHGAGWLRQAFAMLWAHRVRWLLLLLTYYVLILTINFVPYVGPFVAPMLKPVFAVGFLAAAWSQERGEAPAIRHLFAGFRANLR